MPITGPRSRRPRASATPSPPSRFRPPVVSASPKHGLYSLHGPAFPARRFGAKTGRQRLLRPFLWPGYRILLLAGGAFAFAHASSGALVGFCFVRTFCCLRTAETRLVEPAESILDQTWRAHGADCRPGGYGHSVLCGCDADCVAVPFVGERSFADSFGAPCAKLLDRTHAAWARAADNDESILGESQDVLSKRLLGFLEYAQEVLALANSSHDARAWRAARVCAGKRNRPLHLYAVLAAPVE
jgi:hypothetical protein